MSSAAIEAIIRNRLHLGQGVLDVIVINEPTPVSGQENSFIFNIDGGFYGAQSVPLNEWGKEHDATKCTGYFPQYFGTDDGVHATPALQVRNGVVLE